METFQQFTPLHAAVLVVMVLVICLAVGVARRSPPSAVPTRAERAVGILFIGVWFAAHGRLLLPAQFDPLTSLPLQICHWTALASGWYLATRWRWLATLLYFWGYGLSTQALITPTLQEGPVHLQFWYFWLSHGMIVGVPAYALAVHRYRPTWADWRLACLAGALYAGLIIPLNVALGANYGFLGQVEPQQPTLIDLLGPWPWRLPLMFALVAGIMGALMIPWTLARRQGPSGTR